MKRAWTQGNRVELLENGEEFYPAVFEAIGSARREVLIETFILFEDKVGLALQQALLAAARGGVQVDLTIDGFGSPDLSTGYIEALIGAGVRMHVFDPAPRLLGYRTNLLRRLHRKLVVVDGETAFVGGINYSADHLADHGPEAKQDYAVRVHGPVAAVIRDFMRHALDPAASRQRPPRRWLGRNPPAATQAAAEDEGGGAGAGAQALLVTRDNHRHPNDIERHYLAAIRSARRRILIANAYFFPGYRLIRELRRAAGRGVQVELVLQGCPDMPFVRTAATLLYHHLIVGGVQIHEYCERPLHGKVALVDERWATVGSSNLDPLSLTLNLEANLVIRDRDFNATLAARLQQLIDRHCRRVQAQDVATARWWHVLRSVLVFHALRRFPAWAARLPVHRPELHPPAPSGAGQGAAPP